MKRKQLLVGLALIVLGALIGAGFAMRVAAAQFEGSGTGQRPAEGYAFWNGASDEGKLGYLAGFLDAEQYYRLAIDRGFAPRCGADGQKTISDFEEHYPVPDSVTIDQFKRGIDIFYTDGDNRGIGLFTAGNIVRLRLLKRPQAEIDDAIIRARQAQSSN